MNSIRYIIVFSILGFFSGCVTTEKILDGASAFERKRYAQAIQFFLSEYETVNQKKLRPISLFIWVNLITILDSTAMRVNGFLTPMKRSMA